MRNLITTMALLALIGNPVAMAQTGSNAGSAVATSTAPARDAPIGHRQPRSGNASEENNSNDPNDILSRENAALDKKIKNICRGC